MRQMVLRSGFLLALASLLLITGCAGIPTRELQTTGVLPIASPSPIVRLTSVPSLTPTVIPTASLTASDDLSWLTPRPPTAIGWKTYQGRFEAKNIAFSYQYPYPADWFIYPHGVQSFSEFDLSTPRPLGDFPKEYAKIDVGFVICVSPEAIASGDCHPTGTPITVAGLPGFVAAYPDPVDPGLEIRTVSVQKDKVILTMTAFLVGNPDLIKAYEQIFGYMVSTVKFDP